MTAKDSGPPRYSAAQMLAELSLPTAAGRESHAAFLGGFVLAVDPMIDLLFSTRRDARGEQALAVRHLVGRVVNDLVASVHLLLHGYLNQAYGTLRMAYEGCDLLELIGRDANEATRWATTEKGWTDFSPKNVRTRLGSPGVDPTYSHLSEHAHPRFAAAHLTAYGRVPLDAPPNSKPQIVLQLGPFLVDEHPALWHAAIFVTQVTSTLALRASHLALSGAVTERAWDDALSLTADGVQRMAEAAVTALELLGNYEARAAAAPYFDDLWNTEAACGRKLRSASG